MSPLARRTIVAALIALPLLLCAPCAHAQTGDTLVLKHALALPVPRKYAETVIALNPVEAALAGGTWKSPAAHRRTVFPGYGPSEWTEISVDSTGWFEDTVLNGCYLYGEIESPRAQPMLLAAMGDEMIYVNGAPRAGNPYGLKDSYESWEPRFDYSILPVDLRKGKNEFLVRSARGRFRLKLFPPPKPVLFNTRDATLPDLIAGSSVDTWGAVVVISAASAGAGPCILRAEFDNQTTRSNVGTLQPFSVRKIRFRLAGSVSPVQGDLRVKLSLLSLGNSGPAGRRTGEILLDTATVLVRIVRPGENRRETFISAEDGSVQYYAVLPASDSTPAMKSLVLSLHGASVEAINQSGSYEQKPWAYIVAPTNRRPYGFNWEDWGELDALQVLGIARTKFPIDTTRIYLTGHSMGGHGTWHIGTVYPDRFAAIAPSAGWISFWTYRFRGQDLGDTTPVREMIRRSTGPSETFTHLPNLSGLGVYVLHGSEDDNVPVTESRSIVDSLKAIQPDLVYHEEPGAGHWWDKSGEPGADCVDWAPMFDFFSRHARPEMREVRDIDFTTANPGVSASEYWATVVAQERQLKPSRIRLRFDPGLHRFSGSTSNVAILSIDCSPFDLRDSLSVLLDGQTLRTIPAGRIWLSRQAGVWQIVGSPADQQKNPRRYGTLKEAFRHDVLFIYGTQGSEEENRWAFDKARYDAEKLWYQGNGSVEVLSDRESVPLIKHPENRSVVLYGNSVTNGAWKLLLRTCPVQVGKGKISMRDGRTYSGDDLGCILIRPRDGVPDADVAAITGTGIRGMNSLNRIPYLSPGINLPDCTILSGEYMTKGDEGVLFTGYFGLDWSVERGEFVSGRK